MFFIYQRYGINAHWINKAIKYQMCVVKNLKKSTSSKYNSSKSSIKAKMISNKQTAKSLIQTKKEYYFSNQNKPVLSSTTNNPWPGKHINLLYRAIMTVKSIHNTHFIQVPYLNINILFYFKSQKICD